MGRAWRNGQTDVAIGAAGLTVLHGYAGAHDGHGNELVVTEVAVADEIAAAADLVKGKLTGDPGGGGARTDAARRRVHRAHAAARPARTTCSGSAPRRRSHWAAARRSCCAARCAASARSRSPPSSIEAAVAEALTAPAPHHTRPVRFVWVQDRPTRARLLDGMKDQWRADLTGDGRPADAVERRVGRGQILYDAPELVIPFMVPDGAHSYPGRRPHRRRAHHVHRRRRRRGAGAAGGAGGAGGGQLLDRLDHLRRRPGPRRARRCPPTGSRWAPSRSATPRSPSGPRDPVPTDGLLVRTMSLHASAVEVLTDWRDTRSRRRTRCGTPCWRSWPRRPDACLRACVPGHITASALVLDHTGTSDAADPAPAGRPLAAARRALRGHRHRHPSPRRCARPPRNPGSPG